MSDVIGLARTVDEGHLYMDLHPCECGSAQFDRSHRLVDVDGQLVSQYTGPCASCGSTRSFAFVTPEVPSTAQRSPAYFGDDRSQLMDAGEWLFIADRYASAVPAIPPDDLDELRVATRRIGVALEAIEQVLQFVDDDTDEIDPDALVSDVAVEVWRNQPGRLRTSRLRAVRDSYRATTQEYVERLASATDDES